MNPPAILLAVLQAAIAVALLFVVPGLTLGPVLAPGASTPLARIGRAAGVSLLATATTCMLLARFGLLRPTIVVLVLLGLSILPLHSRIPRLPRLPRARARRWWLGAIAAIALVAILVVLPSRLTVGPGLLPFTSTVWYYANLARVVATTGGFPADLPEWGGLRPFQSDYLPVTAHTAAAMQLLPGDMLVQIEIYRLAVLVVTLLLATLLFRRWVSTWVALLGAVLLLATVRMDAKFLSYKPETVALALALFTLWLADRAIAERSRRLSLAATFCATIVFLSHAEVFLVLVAALVGLAAGRALVERGGGPVIGGGLGHRFGRRFGLRRRVARAAFLPPAVAIWIVLASVLFGAVANAALVGQFRLLGYVAGGASPHQTPVLTRLTEIPDNWKFSGDPTWDFYVAAVAPASMGQAPPSSFIDSRLLPRAILDVWPGLDARGKALLLVLLALLALPVVAWPSLDSRRQRMLLTWAVFGVLLAVGAWLLFALSSTYVPRRIGPRRLMPYELFLPVVAAAFALWLLDRTLRPAWRALLPARRSMLAAGIALAVVATGMVAPAPVTDAGGEADPGLTPVGLATYRWIAANTPPDARILANAYTDGSIAALAERTGIVDGRAVYLENPQFLAESTALVLGARVVFAHPNGSGARSYLAREAVDYLLVAGPGATGADLGGYRPFDTDLSALSGGRYTLVGTFGDGRLLLFKVGSG